MLRWILAPLVFSITFPLHAAPEKVCRTSGECVSRSVCSKTLVDELAIDKELAHDICGMKNDLYEFDIIRRKSVLQAIPKYVRYYDQRGIWNFSALQLLLISMYHLPEPRTAQMFACAQDFHENIGVRILRAHDACNAIHRFHPLSRQQELRECSMKYLADGVPAEQAFSDCIKGIFH